MFFNDPIAAHILQNADLIEARQARTPHKRERLEPPRPPGRRRIRAALGSLSRRPDTSAPGFLSDAHELFVGHDQRQLTRLGQFFRVVDVPAGTTLGQQGHVAEEFVTVLRGGVGVTIDGNPHAVLDDGSHFGAVPLLADTPDAPHSATFTVMTPTRIAVADAEGFRSMLAEFPLVAQRVQAMVDVRRAYLAGLAHVNPAERPGPFTPAVGEYPVHVVRQPPATLIQATGAIERRYRSVSLRRSSQRRPS